MLKVMIIGCGGIAPAHINGYLNAPDDAVIAFLADSNIARAGELIEKFGLTQARALDDYRQGLAEADIVSICTPPQTHLSVAVEALENGCHVLLEKPMAPSLQECDLIQDAAKKNDRVLTVVVQSRFISGIRNVIELVRSAEYGRNLYTRIHSVWYRGESYYDLSWRGRWTQEGGGCTQNHSIHHIDLMLWAKGMPTSVRSYMTNLAHHNSEEEDFSSSLMRYADGTVAELTSSLVSHGEPQSFIFQMEKAGVRIPFAAYASKVRENGFPEPDEEMAGRVTRDFESRPKLALEHHSGQIRNFIDAVNGKVTLFATASDGRACIELITGIYQSAVTGEEVFFPIEKGSVFYTGEWRKTAPHFFEKSKDIDYFHDTAVTDFKNKF